MKEFINFNRFVLVVRRLLIEKGIALLGLTFAVLFLDFLIFRSLNYTVYSFVRQVLYYFGLNILVFSSMFFVSYEFETPTIAKMFLTLPASLFEKWLAQILIGALAIICLYLPLFYVLDSLMLILLEKDPVAKMAMNEFSTLSKNLDLTSVLPLTGIFTIQICFVVQMGVQIFKKQTLLKIILSFIGYYISILVINNLLLKLIFGTQVTMSLFSNTPFQSALIRGQRIELSTFEWYSYVWLGIVLVLLLIIPFFKLKDKEV